LVQGVPLLALCLAAGIGMAVGVSLARPPQKQRRVLIAAGLALTGASLVALLISFRLMPGVELPVGVGFHPVGLAAVCAAGICCVGAAAVTRRGNAA
jgi:hypothetical protein